MKKILVTGGCGFIGSHTVCELLAAGYDVVILDNLNDSYVSVLDGIERISAKRIPFHEVDLRDINALRNVFETVGELDGIIHFAAFKRVGESIEKPLHYFDNNVRGMMNLLDLVAEYKVPRFVFSSSCTVYGDAEQIPVTEKTPIQRPTSPYGSSKMACELMLMDVSDRYDFLQTIILRYFNPAGAHPTNEIGENCKAYATNLVPILAEVAMGQREKVTVFGSDYDTPDGTCVRDYIHVMDLAGAHVAAVKHLESGKQPESVDVFNLGMGKGVSVKEIIESFERVNNMKVNHDYGPRRQGDVGAIFANTDKAKNVLGWEASCSLDEIVKSAWAWEQKRVDI